MDRHSIAQRLQALNDERCAGHARLQEMEARQRELQNMLSRIDGAIQALEELLGEYEQLPAPTA
ncbi:hypothetical protein [Xanthomonas theicola]|uniref:Uncharacterized protein n=1 Tax=Xanthomonas theicola TaxID=56464 RepID=A0A2S6ZEZ6_9XANT|nr:hypothetical protein [Xanthomonas theicola]PPT90835.1 hypothetical protein XthCFBP4691_10425 [Xanthomonas theicola]QNH26235.1 hypothetical protein G4Q83_17910 [Xanthomonas theicola]